MALVASSNGSFALLVTLALYIAYRFTKHRSITHIKGPKSTFLIGNIQNFYYQENVGDLDFQYMKDYGLLWRMSRPLGRDVLLIADPKALQHIFHKSAYNYPKSADANVTSGLVTDQSIFNATDGHSHSRHRKVMNPAFSAPQLRSFLPAFRENATKMCRMWKEQILDGKENGEIIAVNKWLARMTLDVLGQTAFQYDFGALDGTKNDLADAYDNMFADSQIYPSLSFSLFRETWGYMPDWLLRIAMYIPTQESVRFRGAWSAFEKVANVLVDDAMAEANAVELEKGKKDVMSTLVRANLAENPSLQLSKREMVSEMSGLTVAGHETTANTLTWLLWELSKNTQLQDRLREEIRLKRQEIALKNRDRVDFNLEDLESMPFLQALLKEVLRFHPIVYHLTRYAAKDDVLPLSESISTIHGEIIQEVPISKGQLVQLSLCGYNRIKSIWGEDADVFNPTRFLDGKIETTVKVGVFANLMSFSAGMRGCIGWRFALIEMQAVIVALIEKFEFSLPSTKNEILRMPVTLMSPMVKGKLDEGVMMPLLVRSLEA